MLALARKKLALIFVNSALCFMGIALSLAACASAMSHAPESLTLALALGFVSAILVFACACQYQYLVIMPMRQLLVMPLQASSAIIARLVHPIRTIHEFAQYVPAALLALAGIVGLLVVPAVFRASGWDEFTHLQILVAALNCTVALAFFVKMITLAITSVNSLNDSGGFNQ